MPLLSSSIQLQRWPKTGRHLHVQCTENVIRLKPQCERSRVPPTDSWNRWSWYRDGRGGYKTNPDIKKTVALARQSVELGADVVKADIAENLDDTTTWLRQILSRGRCCRGAVRAFLTLSNRCTHRLMAQGASGIVYGRNIFQHPHPARMVRACHAVVHEGATVEQAMAILARSE